MPLIHDDLMERWFNRRLDANINTTLNTRSISVHHPISTRLIYRAFVVNRTRTALKTYNFERCGSCTMTTKVTMTGYLRGPTCPSLSLLDKGPCVQRFSSVFMTLHHNICVIYLIFRIKVFTIPSQWRPWSNHTIIKSKLALKHL